MNVYFSFSSYHYYYKEKQTNPKLFLCTLQPTMIGALFSKKVSLQIAQSAQSMWIQGEDLSEDSGVDSDSQGENLHKEKFSFAVC